MSLKFESIFTKTQVTAVKVIQDLIFAASGCHLYLFKEHECIKRVKIFDGQSCLGIEVNGAFNKLLLYGENKIRTLKCNLASATLLDLSERSGKDWIITAIWTSNDNIVVLTMHNIVIMYNDTLEEMVRSICEENCILYSGFLCNDFWEQVIVLSGTVFSEVLIWKALTCERGSCSVLYRLTGHKGVIFSIHCIPSLGLVCSTSDDRTAMLWKLKGFFSGDMDSEQADVLCTVNGHTSRIFRCKILNDCFVTAGEDSLVNVWNFKGNLLKKIVANKGGSVWALDYDANNGIMVIGSEDGSVIAVMPKSQLNVQTFDTVSSEKLKRLVILASGNIIAITEEGSLYYLLLQCCKFELITRHVELKSYALLEISQCRKVIALAGYDGDIFIYKEKKQLVTLQHHIQTTSKNRIFSLHWLTCTTFLTCENDGEMKLWSLKDRHWSFSTRFTLPPGKERWSTAACAISTRSIIVGDRKGNIHLYHIGQAHPVQTIRKAHNHLGITQLITEGNVVFSLGRNGTFKVYDFDIANQKIMSKSSDKLPFSWLSRLERYKSKDFLLGFSGKEFLVWDCEERRCILEHSCGGGHRSWDYQNTNGSVTFAYIKERFINIVTTEWKTLYPKNIIKGLHSSAINALAALPVASEKQQYILLSGGEDTTFQLSFLNLLTKDITKLFSTAEVLKSHLSSIRAITTCIIQKFATENHNKTVEYLLFSAGGRSQIVSWLLTANLRNNGVLSVDCCEQYCYHESPANEESEVRIMDMATIKCDSEVFLFTACSDGKMKVFATTTKKATCKPELVLKQVLMYRPRCILKIFVIQELDSLVTMNTEGNITFWNIKDLFASCDVKDSLRPIAEIVSHQSGVNSYSYMILNNTSCVLLTGGDDNSIMIHVINLNHSPFILAKYQNISSHCAQITGAFITDDYFVTTSIDQRVLLYRWEYSSELFVKPLGRYNSVVADIQGIKVLTCFHNLLYILLYGKGIEIVKVVL